MILFNGVPLGPEVLILVLLVAIVVPFLLAYWVYVDAERRGNDNAALWAVLVGGLTYLTFFGGILALMIYLLDRD